MTGQEALQQAVGSHNPQAWYASVGHGNGGRIPARPDSAKGRYRKYIARHGRVFGIFRTAFNVDFGAFPQVIAPQESLEWIAHRHHG